MKFSNYICTKALLFKLSAIVLIVIISCGYGYKGDLPELGKETRPTEVNQTKEKQTSPENNNEFEFPAAKIYFPRIYSDYKVDRYSEYLKDIKQIEPTLINLQQVIKSNKPDKIQQFSAKVNVLNLYVANLKDKYGDKPEKNYESYKQLVILDKYLMEAFVYQEESAKYRNSVRGSLLNKLEDESYMRKKIDMSLNSLESVLKIIQNAG